MADLEVRSIKLTEIALDPGDPLGQGAFGRVHAGTWLTRNMRVAVKFLHTDEHAFNAEEVEAFKREISLHFKLRSPNIVVVYGCIIDETTRPKPTYAVVMDLMESSVYKRYVQTSAKADMRTLLRVLHQLAVGMCYLHAGGIMHLDIKSLNALLDENGNAKWTDFGLSQIKEAASRTQTALASKLVSVVTGGSTFWMAPELHVFHPPTRAADVYAFGITCFEVLAQQLPYVDKPFRNLLAQVPGYVMAGGRPNVDLLPRDTPSKVRDLMTLTSCWATKPTHRPTAAQVEAVLAAALSALPVRPAALPAAGSPPPAANKLHPGTAQAAPPHYYAASAPSSYKALGRARAAVAQAGPTASVPAAMLVTATAPMATTPALAVEAVTPQTAADRAAVAVTAFTLTAVEGSSSSGLHKRERAAAATHDVDAVPITTTPQPAVLSAQSTPLNRAGARIAALLHACVRFAAALPHSIWTRLCWWLNSLASLVNYALTCVVGLFRRLAGWMASLVYGVVAVLTGIIAMLLACIYYIRDRDINLVWTFVVVSIVPLSMRLIGHVLGLSDPVQVGETTAKYFLGLCYPVLFIKCCVDCFNTSFEVDGVQIKIATPPLFARIGALTHYFYSSNQRQSPADGVPSSVVLSGHTGAIQALAFVPATDGPILASVGDDDTIRLWSVNTGKLRASLKIRSWAPALSVLPNGLLLTAGGLYHNSLRLWDVKQTPPACIKHIPGVNLCRALLAQPDGRIVCGDFEGTVSVFNLATGFRDAEMKGHTSWVTVLVKLRDGRVASSSWDHTIRVWNIASYHCEDVLKGHTAPVEASVQLHDGRLASGDTHEIRLWSINANGGNGTCTGVLLQADSERFKIDSDFRVQALVVLPDGRLASGHKDGNIRMWSLTAVGGSCDRIIKFRSDTVGYSTAQVSVLALLPGGRIAGSSDGFTIRIIDVPSS